MDIKGLKKHLIKKNPDNNTVLFFLHKISVKLAQR